MLVAIVLDPIRTIAARNQFAREANVLELSLASIASNLTSTVVVVIITCFWPTAIATHVATVISSHAIKCVSDTEVKLSLASFFLLFCVANIGFFVVVNSDDT